MWLAACGRTHRPSLPPDARLGAWPFSVALACACSAHVLVSPPHLLLPPSLPAPKQSTFSARQNQSRDCRRGGVVRALCGFNAYICNNVHVHQAAPHNTETERTEPERRTLPATEGGGVTSACVERHATTSNRRRVKTPLWGQIGPPHPDSSPLSLSPLVARTRVLTRAPTTAASARSTPAGQRVPLFRTPPAHARSR